MMVRQRFDLAIFCQFFFFFSFFFPFFLLLFCFPWAPVFWRGFSVFVFTFFWRTGAVWVWQEQRRRVQQGGGGQNHWQAARLAARRRQARWHEASRLGTRCRPFFWASLFFFLFFFFSFLSSFSPLTLGSSCPRALTCHICFPT